MDESLLNSAIGGMDVLAKGIVMMYRAENSSWVELSGGGLGMLVWCADLKGDGSQFFKLLRLEDGLELLSEELYEDFDKNYSCTWTAHETHRFHCMEFADYVSGACFNDKSEAKTFELNIPTRVPKPKSGGILKGLFGSSDKREKPKDGSQSDMRDMVIGAPTEVQHVAHMGWDEQVRRASSPSMCSLG